MKPPEFEDRPVVAEANPDDQLFPGQPSSCLFKVVSLWAGGFTLLFSSVTIPTIGGRMHDHGQEGVVGVFCAMTYLFVQSTGLYHQRKEVRTPRAHVYFALLALFPLWSIPVGWMLTEAIMQWWFYVLRPA